MDFEILTLFEVFSVIVRVVFDGESLLMLLMACFTCVSSSA